jgi:hypothetical protein
MTEKQKAEAKAKREAAAQTGAPKPATSAKPEKQEKVAFNSELDEEEKALFLNHHLPAVRRLKAAVATATANLRNAYKKAKAEGNFTKADFDTAFAVETAENEARERATIARKLKIAKIMGSALGAQLDMFLEPDRTPAVDIASQEGASDALQGKAAKPKYDPSTEQYRSYMTAWHETNGKRVKEGIGKLKPAVEEDVKETAAQKAKTDQQKAVDAQAFDKSEAQDDKPETETVKPPTASSGVPMTRAQFKAQQEQQLAAAGKGKPN